MSQPSEERGFAAAQDPYFVGDWESACAMLECEREECRTPEGNIFQQVLPWHASLTDVLHAWNSHMARHLEMDRVKA